MNHDLLTFSHPDNQTISYRVFGAEEGPETLFFFHGWPSSAMQGAATDATARRLGIRVIAVNRPGLEQSTLVRERRLLDWPEVIRLMADGLGVGRFYVLGISGGAPYAYVTAHALPERVRSLGIACGAPPIAEAPDRKFLSPVYRVLAWFQEHTPWLTLAFVASISPFCRLGAPVWFRNLLFRVLPAADRKAMMVPENYAVGFASFRNAIVSPRAVMRDGSIYIQPWGFDPATLQVPVTLWHGRDDANFHWSAAARIAAVIPGCHTHLLDGEGHYSIPFNHVDEIFAEMIQIAK